MTTKTKGESVRQKLADRLVFKGGFVGLKVYESPRYTVDLDALLIKSNIEQTLEKVRKQAEHDLDDGVWFRFETQVDLATQGEYGGIRHVYRSGIGEVLKNIKKAQIINFDLGIGDPITPGPQKVELNALIGQESISWSVYPIETICAEKLHALISHGDQNSRSKDVHDLAVFLPKTDPKTLKKAIKNCFKFRETKVPNSFFDEIKKLNTSRLQKGWLSAVASISSARPFEEAFKVLASELKDIEGRW